MNPAIQHELARERQASRRRDCRSERVARRIADLARPALSAQLRDTLVQRPRSVAPVKS